MGLWKSSAYCTAHSAFPSLVPILLFDRAAGFLPPRPAACRSRRAQWPSRTALLQRRRRLVLDGREHGGTLWQIGPRSKMIQVEFAFRARIAPQPCIRQVVGNPGHDAVIRIGSEAPGGGPILESGVERHGLLRVAATSDHDRIQRTARRAPKACRVLPCYAARITTPAGTSPVDTKRHRAMRSLRASATIMVLRVPRRAFAVRSRYHNASALPFWNLRKRQAS